MMFTAPLLSHCILIEWGATCFGAFKNSVTCCDKMPVPGFSVTVCPRWLSWSLPLQSLLSLVLGHSLGSPSTSWATSAPFLSYVFPRPPPQLWSWSSVSLLPYWSFSLMALKTACRFMITRYVSPVHFLSWKER